MEKLEQNIEYQILTLRIAQIKNNRLYHIHLKEHGFEGLLKFSPISKDLSNKLSTIEQELKKEYESLELTSENIKQLEEVSILLLNFKEYDETLLFKVEAKIAELTAIKEAAIKSYDFKSASIAREEARQLQRYFNEHKRFLPDSFSTNSISRLTMQPKNIPDVLKYYALGCTMALFFILMTHLYSYCFEHYFRYADWGNIMTIVLLCGIPFGISVLGLDKFKK